MSIAGRFDVVVNVATWVSALLRVAQFLIFSTQDVWRKTTFAVLAALLGMVAISSGMRL